MFNRYLEKSFYWKIFNKNWDKPKNLIDYLIKNGFICIGQGWYSTTYALPNSSYVIKINSGDFDYGYAYFIDICLKYYTPYNHLPEIIKYKKYNFDKGQNFYFILLPKYNHYPIHETNEIKNIRNNLFSFCPVLEKTVDTTLYEFDICKENILVDNKNNLILSDIILSKRNR